MLLFVKEDCTFCKDLPKVEGLQIMRVGEKPEGTVCWPENKMREGVIPVPPVVTGLPALVMGTDIYIGKDIILPKIKELAEAA